MVKSENRYNIPLATAEQINKIINKLNPNKATGPDKILPKIVILSANIIEGAKIATVHPIYKKSDRDKIENYRLMY